MQPAQISPVLLVDGMAAGVWSHQRKSGRAEVTVEAFQKLTALHKEEIAEETDRLGSFLGAPSAVGYSVTS